MIKMGREKKMKDLKKYFDQADKDGDDEISKQDWFEALTAANIDVTKEDVDKLFRDHDKDGDGKLSWREFVGEETKNERAFKLMDENHDGKITKSEFKKFCHNLSSAQVTAAFAKFDISGDDKLDYQEFCGMMNNRGKEKQKERELEKIKNPEDSKRTRQ